MHNTKLESKECSTPASSVNLLKRRDTLIR